MNHSFLERYLNGEHEAVWLEVGVLRETELEPEIFEDVQAVALETMRRVQHNLELIASRLKDMGFVFGEFEEDGQGFNGGPPELKSYPIEPLENAEKLLDDLSGAVNGTIPLAFRVFAEQVGQVDFRGFHERFKTKYLLDALMVECWVPSAGDVQDWLDDFEGDEEVTGYWHPFAPDEYHKENVSGGSPYSLQLPHDRVDPPVLNVPFEGTFVAYLRHCILEHACFPGFADIPSDLLESLRHGLLAF